MNPHAITDLASYRTHEIRSQVADCRRSSQLSQPRAARTGGAARQSHLRSLIGFTRTVLMSVPWRAARNPTHVEARRIRDRRRRARVTVGRLVVRMRPSGS